MVFISDIKKNFVSERVFRSFFSETSKKPLVSYSINKGLLGRLT